MLLVSPCLKTVTTLALVSSCGVSSLIYHLLILSCVLHFRHLVLCVIPLICHLMFFLDRDEGASLIISRTLGIYTQKTGVLIPTHVVLRSYANYFHWNDILFAFLRPGALLRMLYYERWTSTYYIFRIAGSIRSWHFSLFELYEIY